MSLDEFNWNTDPDVIIRQQLAVAAWLNQRGELIIRQERDWSETDDHVVIIAPANIQPLIDKLLLLMDQLAESADTATAVTSGKPASAAAERQRRYRERKKGANVVCLPEAAE